MLIPYNVNHELEHYKELLTVIIPNLYTTYPGALWITTFLIGFPLFLIFYHRFCVKPWRFVEGVFVYPEPNLYRWNYFFSKQYFREALFFWGLILAFFVLVILSHYVWFLFIFKLILVLGLAIMVFGV